MKVFWLLMALLVGCASPVKKMSAGTARARLFPDGLYRHAVSLKLSDGTTRDFDGIVDVTPKRIKVIGLSGFGTTMFRIEEERDTAAIHTTIYLKPLKPHEAEIVRFYRVLRKMMLLPVDGPLKVTLEDVEVRFSDYDENRVPGRIEMHHPKFDVAVKMVGYDA